MRELARRLIDLGLRRRYDLKVPGLSRDQLKLFQKLLIEAFSEPEKPESYDLSQLHCKWKLHSKVALVSGGVDSTVMYFEHQDAYPLYINLGQIYAWKEKRALKELGIPAEEVKIEGLDLLYSWSHIIPGRNLAFILVASEFLKPGGEIWLAATAGEIPEKGGDKSESFFSQAEAFFSALGLPLKIRTLGGRTKTELVRDFKKSRPDAAELLQKTVSCYSGREGHCGCCRDCLNRFVAFKLNSIEGDFQVFPLKGAREEVERYRTLMGEALRKRDFGKYSEKRCREVLSVIGR